MAFCVLLALLLSVVGPASAWSFDATTSHSGTGTTAGRHLATNYAIESQAKDCTNENDGTGTGALNQTDCVACMNVVEDTGTLASSKYACTEQMCQNVSLFPNIADAANGDVANHPCVYCIARFDTDVCRECFTNVPAKYTGLAGTTPGNIPTNWMIVQDARDWCIDECALKPPGLPDGENTYFWACAQCANIPPGPERQWCYDCMNSTNAQVWPKGIASKWEVGTAAWPRRNDFGACAYQANATYWTNKGVLNPGGVYAQCSDDDNTGITTPDAPSMGVTACIECMSYALDYDGIYNGAALGVQGPQPASSSKAYACAATCRNPKWLPADTNTTAGDVSGLVDECVACVADKNVQNAWGCSNCVSLFAEEHKWNVNKFDVSHCLTCVSDDPYENKVGAYSWACGECANLVGDMLDLCLDCIHNRAVLAGAGLSSYLMNMTWVGDTSVVIGDCVDMFKTLWDGDSLFDWWTDNCPKCTAMQKTCYRRRNS